LDEEEEGDKENENIKEKGVIHKFEGFYHHFSQNITQVESSSQVTASGVFNETFYNQLNDFEKDVYDRIFKISNKIKPDVKLVIIYPYKVSSSNFNFEKIFSCITLDHPQFWWMAQYDVSIKYEQSSEDEKSYNTRISIDLYNEKESIFAGYTIDKIASINESIEKSRKALVDHINSLNLTSKYEIIKYLHDYFIRNVNYKDYSSDPHIYTLYGALVEKESVCEGYAEAFKYIADEFGINAIIARSKTHEWNFVEINGKWYILDVTWDDPVQYKIYQDELTEDTIIELYHPESGDDSNLIYDYFLIGTETEINNKKYSTDKTHELVYSAFSSTNNLLVYPPIEKEAFVYDPKNDEVNVNNETITNSTVFSTHVTSTVTSEIHQNISTNSTIINDIPTNTNNNYEFIPTSTSSLPTQVTITTTTIQSSKTKKITSTATSLFTNIIPLEITNTLENEIPTAYYDIDDTNLDQEKEQSTATKVITNNSTKTDNKAEHSRTSFSLFFSIIFTSLILLFL
jgi:hypothetical protein